MTRSMLFQKIDLRPRREKKNLLSAALMETVSEAASSIWKVPLKLPSVMELNLPVGIPVVCLWDKTWKPLGDGVGVG